MVLQSKSFYSTKSDDYIMGKRTRPKKQHYVPKLHLKHFANRKGKKNYYLYYFDKKSEIVGKININDAAMENHFYGTDVIGQTIEHSLSIFESNINKHVYRDLISSEDHRIFEILKYRGLFSQFVATQFIRTKDHREDLKINNKLVKEKILDGGSEEEFKTYELGRQILEMDSDKFVKEMQLKSFKVENVNFYANIFGNKKWVLLVNNTPIPFWTSDNPIARFNPFKFEKVPNMGLIFHGMQVYFPLSNKLCLCMLDPFIYRSYNKMERIDPLYVRLNILQVDKVFINCIIDVIFINSLQLKECYRQVFSKENDFKLAKDMIEADPSIKDVENKTKVTIIKNWRGTGRDLIVTDNIGHK